MKLTPLFVTLLMSLASSFAAQAADNEPKDVLNNMAHEAIECAAYNSIVAFGLENSDDKVTAARARKTSSWLTDWAIELTNRAGLKSETVNARMTIAIKQQMAEIDGDMGNISILLAKYAYLCKSVAEDPQKRMVYWMNKKRN